PAQPSEPPAQFPAAAEALLAQPELALQGRQIPLEAIFTFQAGQALLDRRPRPCSSHHHCWLRLLEGADRAGLLLILSQVGLRLSLRLSVPIEGLPRQLVLAPASGQLSTPKPAGRFLLPALAFGEQQVLVRYSPAQLF